jgi:hypothetical protein
VLQSTKHALWRLLVHGCEVNKLIEKLN